MLVERFPHNPILKPNINQAWEAGAVFNGCPVIKGNKIYLLYRAISIPHYHASLRANVITSDIGIAVSKDGVTFNERRRFIVPDKDWEKFGCEDPRITKLNGKYFIFYTAVSSWPPKAETIRVGVALSKDLKKVDEKHLVTPFNAKAMALFPEKIQNKIWAILTVNTDKPPAKIALASFSKEEEIWSLKYWEWWYQNLEKHTLPLQRSLADHIEVGTPPLKTKAGWLIFYSYIRNYFSPDRIFGVEAIILDKNNPLKIIAQTDFPLLSPEEYYEKYGLTPNVVFPSGAFLKKNKIYLYYGAADTTCALAFVDLPSLLKIMIDKKQISLLLKRATPHPIIAPIKEHQWESKATFNPGAIYLNGKIHIVYRAMSEDNTSTLGYATSKNGVDIDFRADTPIYVPRENFEQKAKEGVNSGCEDPRLTRIGNKIYMCYTAFNGVDPPRVALTSIEVKDFLNKKWNWAKPVIISGLDLNDKDAFVFPTKVLGSFLIVHRVGYDIDYSFTPTLSFEEHTWLEEQRWIPRRKGWWDSKKVGAAAPPVFTKYGWIMFYHGISEDNIYRVGAVLLDKKNPLKVIGRTIYPVLEPEKVYEKEGQVSNVVFPCGVVKLGETIFVYYGGGDRVVGVATVAVEDIIKVLKYI